MDKLYSDLIIHSITYKLADREWTSAVGGTVPTANLKITRIIRDEDNFEFYGELCYAIYVKGDDGKEFLWRSVPNSRSPIITYDAND
jgi:hypothetical protein